MSKDTLQPYRTERFANHLANRTERMASAGKRLPKGLHKRIITLEHLSELARVALANVLPKETLACLSVVNHNASHLTISVHDTTTANHLYYLKEVCLGELTAASEEFRGITHLKVIVSPNLANNYQKQPTNTNQNTTSDMGFSCFDDNTKRTITQAIENVINNRTLEMELKKLFNQE
ncbi:MAG: hypothetical protein Q4G13_07605 [Moraxella sp.]|nr:hypothetical protein [Moraxella sp.]